MTAPTVALSKFDTLIMPFAPGAPHLLVRNMARQAAIAYCERTRIWREIVTVAVDEQNEAIVAPDHAAIFEIEEATWEGVTALEPTQFTDHTLLQRAESNTASEPSYITQTHPNTVAVIPFATGTLTVSLFLKPRYDTSMATEAGTGRTIDANDLVPEFLLLQHAEAITHGALARLLHIPNMPFTNPAEAQRREALFRECCDGKFASNLSMQHRTPPRTRFQEY